ncbi:hypothetical protein BOM_0877 (plasmid) [Borrelia miyamotoi FR64b]|nr:hypothetical protein BOM_0877 [Borrelia miyamotoi FR64b]
MQVKKHTYAKGKLQDIKTVNQANLIQKAPN